MFDKLGSEDGSIDTGGGIDVPCSLIGVGTEGVKGIEGVEEMWTVLG